MGFVPGQARVYIDGKEHPESTAYFGTQPMSLTTFHTPQLLQGTTIDIRAKCRRTPGSPACAVTLVLNASDCATCSFPQLTALQPWLWVAMDGPDLTSVVTSMSRPRNVTVAPLPLPLRTRPCLLLLMHLPHAAGAPVSKVQTPMKLRPP